MSMLVATSVCFSCNVLLIFVIYFDMKNKYTLNVYKLMKFISVWAEIVSIIHVLLISFQRYIAVTSPFKINDMWMLSHFKKVCLTIWCSTLMVTIGFTVADFFEDDIDFYRTMKIVQSYMALLIIVILVYFYSCIVYHLTKRHMNKSMTKSSTNLRALCISMALGVAFSITFLPRSIHVILFYNDRRLAWTVYLYIVSYSFDSFLIVSKFLFEKYYLKEKRTTPIKLSTTSKTSLS